ncbi:MAG: hypothetical protein VW450_06905 [Chloroflexota bacterium]
MLKAAFIGAAVIFALIAIPVVHFLTAIPSPFIGGYMAGARAGVRGGQAFTMGMLLAALLVGPVIGVMALSSLLLGFSVTFALGLAGAFAAYIFLAGSVGAAIGGEHVRKQAAS